MRLYVEGARRRPSTRLVSECLDHLAFVDRFRRRAGDRGHFWDRGPDPAQALGLGREDLVPPASCHSAAWYSDELDWICS